MQEITKIVSSFGDVVQTFKNDNKYIVRVNEIFASDREFNSLDEAREFAETKKSNLDFRHVIVHSDGSVGEVAVFASGLYPETGDNVVKISIAEAHEMGLERLF